MSGLNDSPPAQIGRYEILRRLAMGGMAEVFLARAAGPMGFEKTCVVKRILPHLAQDENFVQMFLAEARLAAQLNHPNVVQIFDFGESDGAWFLAMEYIDGPNLRALFRRAAKSGRALPFAHCAKIISLAAEGLDYAHEFRDPVTGAHLGLIHRDISPDNVLMSRNGAVKVVDFGIAKAADQTHITRTGVVKGKLAYMPPEQLQAKALDRRADVFALGMVLYELLAGSRPFDAKSDVAIMQAILFEQLIPISERRPDVPPALAAILERALSKDREGRYPTCRAMQADLERFIVTHGEPVGGFELAAMVAEASAPADPDATVRTPMSVAPARPSGSGPLTRSRPGEASTAGSAAPARAAVERTPASLPDAEQVEVGKLAQSLMARVPVTAQESMTIPERPGRETVALAAAPSRRSRLPMIALGGVGALGAAILALVLLRSEGTPVERGARAEAPAPVAARAAEAVEVAPVAEVAQAPVPALEVEAAPAAVVEAPEAVAESQAPAVATEPEVVAAAAKTPNGTGRDRRRGPERRVVAAAAPVPAAGAGAASDAAKPAAPTGTRAVAATERAFFRVESSPPAQVRVNGKFVGLAPVRVQGVSPGDVEVEIYDSQKGVRKKEHFRVTDGDNGTLRVVAEKATLEFRVRPYANVFLDGKPLGQTPFSAVELFEGTHSVRLVNAELGKEVTQTVTVKPGQNVFRFNLAE